MKLLETLDHSMPDTATAETLLRANARLGIAATAGGGFGSIAGTLAPDAAANAKVVGIIVASTVVIMVVALFVRLARNPPNGLVKRFAQQVRRARDADKPVRILAEGGATAIGAAAFVFAFAMVMVLAPQ